MFIRQKRNKSGSISVQIIDKSSGTYQVKKTIGSSKNLVRVNELVKEAELYIEIITGQGSFDFTLGDDQHFYHSVYDSIDKIKLVGPELVLGAIYDQIGFNAIEDELFRHLVITRLVYPVSKLKTLDYLLKHKGVVYEKDKIYRYLDKLHHSQIQRVQEISYQHTVKILGGIPHVVFYDVTTLYFEAEDEDDLRKAGFSKDGKHKNPQIVLGLLVSFDGYPLDYTIFEGNTFEGHTMIPALETFKRRYQLDRLVVVADAGLMSNKNLTYLVVKGYEFIIGARIKNETEELKKQILGFQLNDGDSVVLPKENSTRLIIGYSEKRAKNDAFNRDKGLKRLEKQLSKAKLSKKHLNNRGYNKYLKLEGDIKITIDYDKYHSDGNWDGLKGYLTNTTLTKEQIIDHYKHLWTIEKTFRISKTDLRIRPIYHYKRKRIEAHICIAFAACKLYKELERQLKLKRSQYSVIKLLDILKTIYGIEMTLPQTGQKKLMIIEKDPEQKHVMKLFTEN